MSRLDDLVMGTVYNDQYLAVDAVYTPSGGAPVTIRVHDFRQGVAVSSPQGPGSLVLKPEIWVRKGSVADPPTGGTLLLDGTLYTILNWLPRLNGDGAQTGELRLMVRKV